MKLSVKILITLAVATFVVLGIVGFLSFGLTKSALEQSIGANQLEIARGTMDKIDRLLYERYLDTQAIAKEEPIEVFLARGGEEEEVNRRMRELTFLSGPWDILFLVDKEGIVVASTDKGKVGERVSQEPHSLIAHEAAFSGEVYHSDVVISKDTGKATVIFAAPIRDESIPGGPIVGVVISNFSWRVVLEILEDLGEGTHLYNTQGLLIGTSERKEQKEILVTNHSDRSFVQRALGGEAESALAPSLHGAYESLISYAPQLGYLGYRGSGWALMVETPTSIAFAPANKTASQLTFFIILPIILAGVIILLMITRFVVKPVTALTRTVRAIGEGDLSKRAKVSSKDEIGQLAVAFNEMTSKLEKSYGSLSREKEKVVAILQSIGDGVFVVDTNYRIIAFNRVASKLTGFSAKEAIGKKYDTILKFVLEEDEKVNDTFVKDAVSAGKVSEMVNHTVLIRKNGKRVAVADSAAPLKDKNNNVVGCVVVFRDVTKEREIDRAKSEFVSLAAHQLRTPLSTINWYTEMLLGGDVDKSKEKRKKYLNKIYRNNQRMVALVNALLNASRIELGILELKPKPINLTEIADDVLEEFSLQVKDKELKIEKHYDANLPTVDIDPDLIQVVFRNLLSNAVQYTFDGGRVTLTIQREKANVLVIVSDTGCGIPEEAQAKIFTKLFRADNAVAIDADGTGLGLYISKSIVEKFGGKIWFESEENKGTKFYVTIPLKGVKPVISHARLRRTTSSGVKGKGIV